MIVIAHRGARAFAPENTLEAFAKAAQMGSDGVELDVQLSAEGVPVIWHDSDLLRCSDAELRFPGRAPWDPATFTLDEFKQLDAGSWFMRQLELPALERQPFLGTLGDDEASRWISAADRRHFDSGQVRVPTLRESLACCRELNLRVYVELKSIPSLNGKLPARVLAEIDQLGMRDQVVISSFDHQHLATFGALAPDVEIGVLTSDRLHAPAAYLASLGASSYNAGCYGPYDTLGFGSVDGRLDTDTIHALREAGFQVAAWTENDPVRMQKLFRAGVDAIYTDYPSRLREVLSEMS